MDGHQFRKAVTAAAHLDIEMRKIEERRLARYVSHHISVIQELIGVEDVAVRRTVVELLRRSAGQGAAALSVLASRLGIEPDVKTRRRLAAAIGDSGRKEAIGMLVEQLDREEHRFAQASLILALGKLGYQDWPDRWLQVKDQGGPVGEALRKAVVRIDNTNENMATEALPRPAGSYLLNTYQGLESLVELDLRRAGFDSVIPVTPSWLKLSVIKGDSLSCLQRLRTVLGDFHIALEQVWTTDQKGLVPIVEAAVANIADATRDVTSDFTFRLAIPRMVTKNEYIRLVTLLSRHIEAVTKWKNNPSNYDVDLRLMNLASKAVMVWRDRRWLAARQGEKYQVIPASIHPTVAAALCLCAVGYRSNTDQVNGSQGKVLLDPACGSGTILREWLSLYPETTAIGFDLSTDAVSISRSNLERLSHRCSIDLGDMRKLPLKDESVDYVVTNLPFGVRVKHTEPNRSLYERFAREAHRILRKGGVLVAYTADRAAMTYALKAAGWNKVPSINHLNAGGLDVVILRISK